MRRHEKRQRRGIDVKRLMILLPVLNEAAGLDVVLEQIPEEALHELGWNSEIVIVDGNSTDNSCLLYTSDAADD